MTADDRAAILGQYHAATARLEGLIEGTPTPSDTSSEAVLARATFRMARLRRFLGRLGNPHTGYPIVHVGGTSGKGSTSTTIASILSAAGFNTGLHTSPYLQSPTEKLQCNGVLIAAETYVRLCDRLFEALDAWRASGEAEITYGEAWFALTALYFRDMAVEFAVLEVGAGGRFDLTNVIDPTVSVITSVGIDHTSTLGSTRADIAWHKAGIVKHGAPAITAVANNEALAIIVAEAEALQAPLTIIEPETMVSSVSTDVNGTSWTDTRTGSRHHIALRGRFQATNGATAVATIEALRGLGFFISDEAIERGLQTARIPGRVELIQDNCLVMLDGAHNAEKVAALAEDVPRLLPVAPDGQRIAVLGVLEAKQALEMVSSLVPVIDVLVATSPQVTAKEAKNAPAMAAIAKQAGFNGRVWVEPDPRRAIDTALALAGEDGRNAVLVTGSLYLVGNIRERWHRHDDIVLAQTSWP